MTLLEIKTRIDSLETVQKKVAAATAINRLVLYAYSTEEEVSSLPKVLGVLAHFLTETCKRHYFEYVPFSLAGKVYVVYFLLFRLEVCEEIPADELDLYGTHLLSKIPQGMFCQFK